MIDKKHTSHKDCVLLPTKVVKYFPTESLWLLPANSPKPLFSLLRVMDMWLTVSYLFLWPWKASVTRKAWTSAFLILFLPLLRPPYTRNKRSDPEMSDWRRHGRSNVLEWFALFFLFITGKPNACCLSPVFFFVSTSRVRPNVDSKKKWNIYPAMLRKNIWIVWTIVLWVKSRNYKKMYLNLNINYSPARVPGSGQITDKCNSITVTWVQY